MSDQPTLPMKQISLVALMTLASISQPVTGTCATFQTSLCNTTEPTYSAGLYKALKKQEGSATDTYEDGTYTTIMKSIQENPINVEISKRINEIASLNYNWDGYNAVTPEPIVFLNVYNFLKSLPTYVIGNLNKDEITPTPYGTIVLDWNKNDELVSVEIGETECGFFSEFNDNTNMELDAIPFTKDQIPFQLATAFEKLYC